MPIDLTPHEIELIVDSIKYSKQHIEGGAAPYALRQMKLSAFDDVLRKLRAEHVAPKTGA